MTTDNDFSAYMKELSLPELMDIISTKRKDYAPEAVAAAEEELTNRNLSPDKIRQIREDREEKNRPDPVKAALPLPQNEKLMLLIFPVRMTWSRQNRLAQEGYYKQISDYKLWSIFGYALYIFIFILSGVLASLCI